MTDDLCIVCMQLLEPTKDLPAPEIVDASASNEDSAALAAASTASNDSDHDDSLAQPIACVQPCAHVMHDECLKPWVEHANRCPLCRARFNLVEVKNEIEGPVVSTYSVADKDFVPDVDPFPAADEYDEEDVLPCPLCDAADDEDILLLCDGCDAGYHLKCLSLDDVPSGSWFCMECEPHRAIDTFELPRPQRSRAHQISNARTRSGRHNLRRATDQPWARLWLSVWDNLNLDLDSPFDDDLQLEQYRHARPRDFRSRREQLAWQRRNEIARRQGGRGNMFGDSRTDFLRARFEPDPDAPTPEQQRIEDQAWKALEKAKKIDAAPPSQAGKGKRKRRSCSASSSEPIPVVEPERKLKRPNTRRPLDKIAPRAQTIPTPSASITDTTGATVTTNIAMRGDRDETAGTPSFLQALLSEVGGSDSGRFSSHQGSTADRAPHTDHTSPASSPTASNFSSPRALSNTPPPQTTTRPGSPFQITSRIEPDFQPIVFSPSHSPDDKDASSRERFGHDARSGSYVPLDQDRRRSRPLSKSSPVDRSGPSTEASPTRATMSLEAKKEVADMVKRVLRPIFHGQRMSVKDYTYVNRTVCHLLYDKIGDVSSLSEGAKSHWEGVAAVEVKEAVEALKANGHE